jgi:hypothetical protein
LLGLPDQRWLPLALSLNEQPAAYVHDSWLDDLPQGALVRRLRDQPLALAGLSRYLCDQLLAGESSSLDFTPRWRRLSLLDAPALMRLCLYLGLTLRNDEIRWEIAGSKVRLMRQSLGDEAYAFAVKRAPFFGAPPVFAFEPPPQEARMRFAMIGARFCGERVMASDPGAARRMALKLPRAWSAGWDVGAQASTRLNDEPGFSPLMNKLIKEVAPPWAPLFV